MNKKIFLIFFIFAAIFLLYSPIKIGEVIFGTAGESDDLHIVDTTLKVDSGNTKKDNGNESSTKNFGKIGFDLRDEELKYILKNCQEDVEVIKLLGEPDKKTEPEVWGIDGLERRTWYYNSKGIQLQFVKDRENKYIISSADLVSPSSTKTSRGIGIGSTKKDVLKAYGNEIDPGDINNTSSKIIVGTIYGGIIFNLSGDRVSGIFIGSSAE